MGLREVWIGSLLMTLAAIAASAACDSAATSPGASCTPDSSRACTDGGAGESANGLASPPPPGPMQPADGAGTVTLAFKALLFGDRSPDGGGDYPDPDAWKYYGYNIDGVPPGNLAAFCMPAEGESASVVHEEGINGIENAFGHLLLHFLEPTATLNCTLCTPPDPLDKFRLLLSLDNLGNGSSYDPLPARVALGGDLDHPPLFDGTDRWPTVQGTTISLPASYLVNDTWVSGPIASLSLPLDLEPVFTFDIHDVVLTMKLDSAHKTATSGILSGVIPTADLQQKAQAELGSIDRRYCSGPTLSSLLAQIAQASDIMQDGRQDPTKTCDGISIGLGFEASVVQLGPTVPAPPMPDPCVGDGGTDG